MTQPVPLAEAWRGDFLESMHLGHAVIAHASGEITQAYGNPDQVILPRSSAKMIQALPLVESGAADAAALTSEHLALASASHNGAAIHTDRVSAWLAAIGCSDDDFRCGPQMPDDKDASKSLICSGHSPCQMHNNCSGKHSGFLTLTRHLGADADYVDPAHPVQKAVLEAFEDVTGQTSPGFGIDGCSAPNFATGLSGFAHAMAKYAAAAKAGPDSGSTRGRAMARLVQAMMRHPELVAGEGRACTLLMRAMDGKVAVKTGAEGVFIAIIPQLEVGIALKVADGATRAAESAITALLVQLGVLDPNHPAAQRFLNAPILNRRGIVTGRLKSAI